MELTIKIRLDGDAFAEGRVGSEVAKILEAYVENIDMYFIEPRDLEKRVLRDSNGNNVGNAVVNGRES